MMITLSSTHAFCPSSSVSQLARWSHEICLHKRKILNSSCKQGMGRSGDSILKVSSISEKSFGSFKPREEINLQQVFGTGICSFPFTELEAGYTSQIPEANRSQVQRAAFFDIDGTITNSNVVAAFVVLRLREISNLQKAIWIPYFAINCIFYLMLDRIDRSLFNRVFYRNYKGRPVEEKEAMAHVVHTEYLAPRAFNGALRHIQDLKSAGFKIVLVTGGLDFIVAPLAKELAVDAVFAAKLKEENGRFSGELEGDAVSSAEKALLVKNYAAKHGVSLEDSHAYGDSIADLGMLEAVGHPFAVKPDARLSKVASERGWPTIDWSVANGAVGAVGAFLKLT